MAQGSWLMAQGSRLMVHGQGADPVLVPGGAPGPGLGPYLGARGAWAQTWGSAPGPRGQAGPHGHES